MAIFSKKNDLAYTLAAAFVILLVAAWIFPTPSMSPEFFKQTPTTNNLNPNISWPAEDQSALAVSGYGVLASNGNQQPAPTASVAKVFTALAVLKVRPLQPDQQGPLITITQADQDSYGAYFAKGGSLVAIKVGEQISERQALEAMLLPSANNMADTLARWAFGSLDKYTAYANNFNASLGLKSTHIDDASGFSPNTVSTAEDLVKIGQLVVNSEVLSAISAEQQATVPIAGTVRSTNWLLGVDGINGIKTGNTEEAGGCYLFSAEKNINGKNLTIIGAVMGAPSIELAMSQSRVLLASSSGGFTDYQATTTGATIGNYRTPWGTEVPIVYKNSSSLLSWYQKSPNISFSANNLKATKVGQKVGVYNVNTGLQKNSVDLVAAKDSGSPPWQWRLYKRYL